MRLAGLISPGIAHNDFVIGRIYALNPIGMVGMQFAAAGIVMSFLAVRILGAGRVQAGQGDHLTVVRHGFQFFDQESNPTK